MVASAKLLKKRGFHIDYLGHAQVSEVQLDLADHAAAVAGNAGDCVVDEHRSATDRQAAESPLSEPARVNMPGPTNRASQPITRTPDGEVHLSLEIRGAHVLVALEPVCMVQETCGHVGFLLGVVVHKPK